ncbi:MAG: hypothetical protein V4629_07070 [Pseudomonadota bacterium]
MTFLEELQDEVLRSKQEQDNQNKKAKESWLHAMTPLEGRLKILLDNIPDSVKSEGLSLPVIQKMLKGRWRGNAHPGELGNAMRKLGYKRVRLWKKTNDGFKTVWKVINV